jgi:hypothetical protein
MIINRSLLAALLTTALALPHAPALAEVNPPAGMVPNAANAVLPTARNNLGASAGNGVNVVTDYGADPTGAADATTAFRNAVNAACNNASPAFQAKDVFIPGGVYLLSGTIPVTNGCWIHGAGRVDGSKTAGATVLRVAAALAGDLFQFRGFGQAHFSDFRMDTTGGFQSGGASYCRVHAAGANYALNDTITLTGGTFAAATVLKVTALSGTGVTGCVIATPGSYSVAPSPVAVVAQGSSSGAGTGATFDMVYANAAGISISGPTTTLTADAASGASVITVASIAGFSNGDAIEIEQDDGTYKSATVSGAPSGTTINLAGALSFKASANHPVYDSSARAPLIENVGCVGFWDCLRIENSSYNEVTNFYTQDFGHDGIIKVNGANPDSGSDVYRMRAWSLSRSTANAGFEALAGGDMQIVAPKFVGTALRGVLLNYYFKTTGTLLLNGGSYEGATDCLVRLHQSVGASDYGNVTIEGQQWSPGAGGKYVCVDTGTADAATRWIRNINIIGNHSNSSVSTAGSLIDIADGYNIVIDGNALNNLNVAGPTAIGVQSGATNVRLGPSNEIVGFPTGSYGTLTAAALDTADIHSNIGVSGTTLPTQAAGTMGIGGIAAAPTLAANGEGDIYLSATNGLVIQGRGSINDISFVNKSGVVIAAIDTTVSMLKTNHLNGIALLIDTPSNASAVTMGGLSTLVTSTNGMAVGTPTGGAKGSGTLNLQGDLWDNGVDATGTAGSGYVRASGATVTDQINQEFKVSTATLTKTSDTTLAIVTGLSQNLTAGGNYNCRGHLTGVSGVSGGIKVALVATSSLSATSTTFTGLGWAGTTPISNTTVTALGSNITAATAIYSDLYIDGSILVNAGGTINVEAAQNASNITATTVLVGSTFSCVRVS